MLIYNGREHLCSIQYFFEKSGMTYIIEIDFH